MENTYETSTITTYLVNDEAIELITLYTYFCSQDNILKITYNPINHHNTPYDDQIKIVIIKYVNLIASIRTHQHFYK